MKGQFGASDEINHFRDEFVNRKNLQPVTFKVYDIFAIWIMKLKETMSLHTNAL